MKDVFTSKLMYETELETIRNKIPALKLMENAGVEIASLIKLNAKVAIFVGPGNNGGDGFSLALNLYNEGADVVIFFVENGFSTNASFYFERCLDKGIQIRKYEGLHELAQFDVLVDAIYGIGFKGELSERYKDVINDINKFEGLVISIDINSGLDADTGLARVAVKSDITIAIEFYKPGHFLNQAKDYISKLKFVDIGIDKVKDGYFFIEKEDIKEVFNERYNFSNKRTFGYVGLIGGSLEYSGAIRLAYMANVASSSGAGLVKVFTPKRIVDIVAKNILEEVICPLSSDDSSLIFNEKEFSDGIKNLDTIAFGMGIKKTEETSKALKYLIQNFEGNLIIDADGLNIIAEDLSILNSKKAKVVLTPHLLEFSRLIKKDIDDILLNAPELARQFASNYDVIVLLKGPSTIIANSKDVFFVNRGTSGMAAAGRGDVLFGVISSVASYYKEDLTKALCAACYLNGVAGEIAKEELNDISMKSSDTAKHLANAIDVIRA